MFEDTVVQGLIKFCFLRCLVIPIRRLLAWIYNSTGSIAFVGLGARSIQCVRFCPGICAVPPHRRRVTPFLLWPPPPFVSDGTAL
jgi:hypothetical protein